MNSYIPLDQVRIATPCSASWDSMTGDDRVRHCSECSLSVYNISEMKKQEAEKLVSNAEGRLCIRMYQRPDGTIITQDCPVGMQAVRARVARKVRAVTAATLTFVGSALGINTAQSSSGELMGKMVYQQTEEVADTTATQDTVEMPVVMMGGMAPYVVDDTTTAVESTDYDTVGQPAYLEVMGEMEAAPTEQVQVMQGIMVAEPDGPASLVVTPEDEPTQQVVEPVAVIEPTVAEPTVSVRPDRVEPGIR